MKKNQFTFALETVFCSLVLSSLSPVRAHGMATVKGKDAKVAKQLPGSKVLGANKSKPRQIVKVNPVAVTCPVGTAPVLPYRVWVTYSNGTGEYRQVRWNNSSRV